MGLYPCSLCVKRFRGPAQTVYPSVLQRDQRISAHLRLCEPCFEQLVERLQARGVVLAEDPNDDQGCRFCIGCENDLGEGESATVFATVYPRGAEREDYIGAVHVGCVPTLQEGWRLTRAA